MLLVLVQVNWSAQSEQDKSFVSIFLKEKNKLRERRRMSSLQVLKNFDITLNYDKRVEIHSCFTSCMMPNKDKKFA